MSRSGYSDDVDGWDLIRWRGQVASATRGRRGQALLSDLLTALDEMPEKRLITGALEEAGEVCALGALGRRRGLDGGKMLDYYADAVGEAFGVARQLAAEIMFQNDDAELRVETPEARWSRMRAWVAEQIAAAPVPELVP